MELWNAYTRDGALTEQILVRDEPIPDGLYHLVSEILVRHTDGSYLAMRRTVNKKVYPGWLETTAGGSALLGEDALACAHRELLEETGIDATAFTEIAQIVNDSNHTIYLCYLCTVDIDKSTITFQEGETDGYLWMNEGEFIEFVNSDRMIPGQKKRLGAYLEKMRYIR